MSRLVDSEGLRKMLGSHPSGALAQLYDLYYQVLLRIAFRFTRDREASHEIVQDTFLHVWEERATLSKSDGRLLSSYLLRVVKNKAITHYKRSLVMRFERLTGEVPLAYCEDAIEVKIIEGELLAAAREQIAHFPRMERICFLMKLDEGKRIDEIASELKVTRKAVERSLTSARKRLRSWSAEL